MNIKNSNTVQAFWVMLGSLSAFGFAIVSSMLLSRYFDKSDYGTYKQVMYVYSSLFTVFTLGLPRAFSYFLPKVNKGQAKDLISKLNLILVSLGAIMSVFLYLGADFIANFLNNNDLARSVKYFAVVPFFMLPTMGIEGILATYRQTKFLAAYKILTQLFTLLCVVVPVIFFNGTVVSAIIGFGLASFLCFVSAVYLKNRPLIGHLKEKSPYNIRQILNYTLPIMGASIWGVIIISSDQFFISRYFGKEVFAEFANGSMELPFVGMVIASTTTVLSPVFSKQIHEGGIGAKEEIVALWMSVLSKTVKIIYPLVVFCFCFASSIMIFFYGEQYIESGSYFQLKLIVNFFTVIAYGPLLLSIGGQKFYYNIHMYGAIVLVLLEWVSVLTIKSPYLITVISVLCQISRIMLMMGFIAKYFKIPLRDLIPYKLILNIVLPSVVLAYLIKYILSSYHIDSVILYLIISISLYALAYGLWVYYRKIEYYSLLKPILISIKKSIKREKDV